MISPRAPLLIYIRFLASAKGKYLTGKSLKGNSDATTMDAGSRWVTAAIEETALPDSAWTLLQTEIMEYFAAKCAADTRGRE